MLGPVAVPCAGRDDPLAEFLVVGLDEALAPVLGDRLPDAVAVADHGRRAVRQAGDAFLAAHLAADVVAVGDVDRDLDVDERAGGHVQEHEDRIAQLLPAGVAAGHPHLDAGHLVTEQPARDIRVVHQRVVERHLGRVEPFRHRRVAVRRVVKERRPKRAAVDHRLQPAIVGVEAAHEADLHETPAERDLRVHHPERSGLGGDKRLLAEDRLPGGDRGEELRLVGGPPGADHHRLDLRRRDQRLGSVEGVGALRRGRLGAGEVDVGDADDLDPGKHLRQPADVVLADHPGADHSDLEAHFVPQNLST